MCFSPGLAHCIFGPFTWFLPGKTQVLTMISRHVRHETSWRRAVETLCSGFLFPVCSFCWFVARLCLPRSSAVLRTHKTKSHSEHLRISAIRYVTRAAHSWGFGGLFGFWPCLGHSDATFCASGCLWEDPDVTFVTSGCLQRRHDVTFVTSGCLRSTLTWLVLRQAASGFPLFPRWLFGVSLIPFFLNVLLR